MNFRLDIAVLSAIAVIFVNFYDISNKNRLINKLLKLKKKLIHYAF